MERSVETKRVLVDQEEINDYGRSEPNNHTIIPFGWKHFFHAILVPLMVTRLLLLLVGMITAKYIYPLIDKKQPIVVDANQLHFPAILWSIWRRFDSGFYLSIAQNGYEGANTLHGMSNWAFFPLYPLLVRIVAFPFGTSFKNLTIAGVIVSNVALIIACVFIYKLTLLEFKQHRIATHAVLLLLIFPLSYYLSAVYPEGLFLMLAISCVYYVRTQRWWLAGALGGLATLARPQGILLAVVFGWEYWRILSERYAPMAPQTHIIAFCKQWMHSRTIGFVQSLRHGRTWSGFLALLLIPCGLFLFCLYGKIQVGTFFPFQIVEKYGWGRSFTNPLSTLKFVLHHYNPPSPYDWNFYLLNFCFIVAYILLLIPVFRKLPFVYGLFSLFFILMPMTTGEINSIARYYMEIFPMIMLIAWWVNQGTEEQRTQKSILLITSFSVILSVFMVLLTLGVYSMA